MGAPLPLAPRSSPACSSAIPTSSSCFTEQGTAWIPEELGTPRLLLRPDGARDRVPGARVGRGGRRPALAAAERVLGPAVPRRLELHAARPRWPCATRSAWTGSCGAATTPTGSRATRTQHEALRLSLRRRRPGRGAGHARRERRRALRLRPRRASAPLAADGRPDRRRDRPAPAARRRSPPRPAAARPSPARPSDRPDSPAPGDDEGAPMGTIRYGARSEERAAQPGGRGDVGRRLGHHPGRHLPDRPRGRRRRAAPAARARRRAAGEGHRGHASTSPGYPTFGAGSFAVHGPPRGDRRLLRPGHADDDRAVGDRRPRDLRRAQEARRRSTLDRDGDRVRGPFARMGIDVRRGRRGG